MYDFFDQFRWNMIVRVFETLVKSTEKKQKTHENFRPDRRRAQRGPHGIVGQGTLSVLFIGLHDLEFLASCNHFCRRVLETHVFQH